MPGKNPPRKKPPVRGQGRVRVKLGIGLGLGSGRWGGFPGGGFFPRTALLNVRCMDRIFTETFYFYVTIKILSNKT